MKKLEEKFEIMAEADLASTEGGLIITTSTAIALGCFRSCYLYVRSSSRKQTLILTIWIHILLKNVRKTMNRNLERCYLF